MTVRTKARNVRFDLLRILLAVLVMLAHAPELTDGNKSRELFSRLTRSDITFGTIAVDGFFLLSGFLMVQSWKRDPKLLSFLRKRVLRIVPGYVVAALLSTVVVGLLAPGVPHFFHHLDGKFLESIFLLSSPLAPPVVPGLTYQLVNGSLWTITYEFRCYLLVAAFGVCGLLRRPWYWTAALVVFASAAFVPAVHPYLSWQSHKLILGDPDQMFRFLTTYFVGGCFHLLSDRIKFRPVLALAAVTTIAVSRFSPPLFELGLILGGGYLMFYLTEVRLPWKFPLRSFPDISYGIYLYGWPVETLWIWYFRGSPWITFGASVLLCCGLGWISWHFVERPMLELRPRSAVPLPPA